MWCVLDSRGQSLLVGSVQRVGSRSAARAGIDVCFVIGGAFGIELPDANHKLSFGPMTLPHMLARVVLLEQLYRAHKILGNEPYHH